MDLREIHNIGERTRERIVGPRDCPALAALGIGLTGISAAPYGFRFYRLKPDMSQLIVCVGGRGRVWIDGRWADCGVGQAYLTSPHVLHAYESVRGEDWLICWVMYNAVTGKTPVIEGPPRLVACEGAALFSCIEGLHREALSNSDAGVQQLWAQLVHLHARRIVAPPESDARLARLWSSVDADLAFDWDLETLANLAETSTEHLRRLCVKRLGRSPMRHVTELRMRRAAALLAAHDYSVHQVARMVGYENPFAFSTAFKRCLKLSPSAVASASVR